MICCSDESVFAFREETILGFLTEMLTYSKEKKQKNVVLALGKKFHIETQVWVQAFSVPAGREEEVGRAVELIAALGIENIAAWSYRAASPMSAIKSANPDLVWQILGEAYKKL